MYSEIINQLRNIQPSLTPKMQDDWLTVKDVCQYSKLSASTLHRATKLGTLKVSKATGKNLFKKAWVDNFLGE